MALWPRIQGLEGLRWWIVRHLDLWRHPPVAAPSALAPVWVTLRVDGGSRASGRQRVRLRRKPAAGGASAAPAPSAPSPPPTPLLPRPDVPAARRKPMGGMESRLQERRKALGLYQAEVAQRAGVPRSTVAHAEAWERWRRGTSAVTRQHLAAVLALLEREREGRSA